jgi:D-xylose transport system permease protein
MNRLNVREFSIGIALLVMVAFFAIAEEQFLGARNLSLLMTELSITATLAMGMLLIILPGHIDLSVGSGVGLLGGIASVLVFHQQWPAPMAMLMALVVGVVIWFLMGVLIVKERIPAFIITLGGLLVFKGLFWLTIENSTVPVAAGGDQNFYSMLTTYYLPPAAGWALAVAIAVLLGLGTLRSRALRRAEGFELESGEAAFLKWFVACQAIALFVLVR